MSTDYPNLTIQIGKRKSELLPCPFCGEKLVQDKYGDWEHIANDCILSWLDSEYEKIFFENREKNIRAWNTRTPKQILGDIKND